LPPPAPGSTAGEWKPSSPRGKSTPCWSSTSRPGLPLGDEVVQAVSAGVAAAPALREQGTRAGLLDAGGPAGTARRAGRGGPVLSFPEQAARVLVQLVRHAQWRARPAGTVCVPAGVDLPAARAICRTALRARGPGWLTAQETRGLLQGLRFSAGPGRPGTTAEEAAALARAVGFHRGGQAGLPPYPAQDGDRRSPPGPAGRAGGPHRLRGDPRPADTGRPAGCNGGRPGAADGPRRDRNPGRANPPTRCSARWSPLGSEGSTSRCCATFVSGSRR